MNAVAEGYFDLLRHGETVGGDRYRGSTDDPLTAAGWIQMWAAVESEAPWNRIITSPLRRCAEFALAMAKRRSIPLRVDPRLRELHFGAWESRTAKDLMARDAAALMHFWHDPVAHPPPGSEPLVAFQQRVLTAWEEHVYRYCGEHVLIITHGGPMRIILGHLAQRPLAELLRIDAPPASLTRIRVRRLTGEKVQACIIGPG